MSEPKPPDCEARAGTCQHAVDLLTEYIDGRLAADLRHRLEQHLAACPPCVEFVNTYRATTKLCKKALAETLPEELAGKLTSFLRQNIKK